MNKIVVEQKEIVLQDESVFITKTPEELVLHIKGNVCLAIESLEKTSKLEVYLEKGSHLLFELLVSMKNCHQKFLFHNEEDTVLDFHLSCTYEGENTLEIESLINHKNVHNYIEIRSVENNGSLQIKATGKILENTQEAYYLEKIRALTTNNERIKISPDLIVKSNEVVANHNATISTVDEAELFYLESLGMKEESAISLIKDGFLKGILQIEDLRNRR